MKTGGWSFVRILGYLFYQSSTNSKTLTQNGQRQKQNGLWASGRCVTIIEGGHQKSS